MIELKLVTYNVWFSDRYAQDRRGALYTLLKAHKPDVAAFQEATPLFFRHLRSQELGEDLDYHLSDHTARGDSLDPYGVLMLSRHESSQFAMAELPSNMYRKLVLTRLEIDGVELVIASVHLESLEQKELRKEQLRLIFEYLEQFDNAVLMGDMNHCSTREDENSTIGESEYTDLWSHLHPDEYGWTMNRDINLYLKHSRYRNSRFDRILLKSKVWEAKSIEIIGGEPINPGTPGGLPLFPSDHFGLVATLGQK